MTPLNEPRKRQVRRSLRDDLIWNRANGKCQICEFAITPALHLHHIQPRERGGNNKCHNLIAICPNCHAVVHLCATWTFEVGGIPFPRLERGQQIEVLKTHGYTHKAASRMLIVASQRARASVTTNEIYQTEDPDEGKFRGYRAATDYLRRLAEI